MVLFFHIKIISLHLSFSRGYPNPDSSRVQLVLLKLQQFLHVSHSVITAIPHCTVSATTTVNVDPFRNMKKMAVKGGAVVDPDSGM